jgi:4-hydroxyphenylacetate 3-monooxygenase
LAALDRVKLFKLVWDLVGSEFAGRHHQYEKFYAGAAFIVRNHSYREAPWDEFYKIADDLLTSYGSRSPVVRIPRASKAAAGAKCHRHRRERPAV